MKDISTDKIVAIVRDTASRHRGIETSIEPAVSTNSVYVTLKQGKVTLPFRISDHKCPKSRGMKNLIITKSTKREHVVRFIENCYNAFGVRALDNAFAMIR